MTSSLATVSVDPLRPPDLHELVTVRHYET